MIVKTTLTSIASTVFQRTASSLTTIPTTAEVWRDVGIITVGTALASGLIAVQSGFIDPVNDWDPIPLKKDAGVRQMFRPISALFFPSLIEEVIWRGMLIPIPRPPSTTPVPSTPTSYWVAAGALVLHVLSHPLAAATVWPRGKDVFQDGRFLLLATIVLGGATTAYFVSGGSAWAAAIVHAIPVTLWRDFFGGEKKLSDVDYDSL